MDNRNSEPYRSEMPILPIYVLIWTGRFCRPVRQWYNQAYVLVRRFLKMKEQKLEKQRQNLVERGVLSPDEKLYDSITINYTEKLVGIIET